MNNASASREVLACPECDCASVSPKQPNKPLGPKVNATNYYCKKCGATFDEPERRPPKYEVSESQGTSGLVRRLLDADPDDVRADGGVSARKTTIQATPCAEIGRARQLATKAINRSQSGDEAGARETMREVAQLLEGVAPLETEGFDR